MNKVHIFTYRKVSEDEGRRLLSAISASPGRRGGFVGRAPQLDRGLLLYVLSKTAVIAPAFLAVSFSEFERNAERQPRVGRTHIQDSGVGWESGPVQGKTRREVFPEQMDKIVSWRELEGLIEPNYPRLGNGRHPVSLSTMVRIHFLQHWFNLSDWRGEVLGGFGGVGSRRERFSRP